MSEQFEGVQITVSSRPTYFTVWTTPEGGFTDKLLQFSAFYRLGRSLGYQYWHSSPLESLRSSSLAFDFVGLNSHLAEFAAPPFQHFRYLDIRSSQRLIDRNKIGSFERLQQYIQASMAHARMTYPEDNLVVRLGIGMGEGFIRLFIMAAEICRMNSTVSTFIGKQEPWSLEHPNFRQKKHGFSYI